MRDWSQSDEVSKSHCSSHVLLCESHVRILFKSGAGIRLLLSLGRGEWTHHPHPLALAERNAGTTCCLVWDHSGSNDIWANTCVTQHSRHRSLWHFLLPQVRLTLHSGHCLLWVSSHRIWESSAHTLCLGAAVVSTAPCPSSSTDLHQCCPDNGVTLNHAKLTTGVGDGGEGEGEQTIRKKWQPASSGYRRAISSCLKKKKANPKPKTNPCWLLWAPETRKW